MAGNLIHSLGFVTKSWVKYKIKCLSAKNTLIVGRNSIVVKRNFFLKVETRLWMCCKNTQATLLATAFKIKFFLS